MTFVISFFLIVLFVAIYLISFNRRHNKRREADKKRYYSYKELPSSILALYLSILDRRHSSIMNYIIFQLTTKVFGFTGVVYSIYGFGLNFYEKPLKELSMLVSFIGLVCVIIALYLSPEKRISEYISAWRGYDKLVTHMIGKFPFYNGKPGNCPLIQNAAAKIAKEISEIEYSIATDES